MTPIETVQALTALARAMTKNFAFTADRAGEVAALLNAGDALATTMAAQETAASRATEWHLVPIEPTPEMLAVDAPPIEQDGDFATMKYRRGIWAAMLRAAKETP